MKKIEKKNIGIFFLMLMTFLVVVIPLFMFTGGQKYYDRGIMLDRHWDVTINEKTYTNVTLSKFTFPMTNKGDVVTLSHYMTEHYKGVNPVLRCEFIHTDKEIISREKCWDMECIILKFRMIISERHSALH